MVFIKKYNINLSNSRTSLTLNEHVVALLTRFPESPDLQEFIDSLDPEVDIEGSENRSALVTSLIAVTAKNYIGL